ncbi:methyltransferase domain-containing protein [Undibacterium flavidum]|uniref:Methyltransferase domain-containing protein n=1 Tax=Undibacterium flavidum TaxID=2762297 RepID=A0ABR6YB17_9BURK|nr:methyltransferase domain-containing protein [Undibacterium flavidum]MBC3873843.1 methyltransferase domain-containing protein [Undibacterium flavidum]
MTPQFFSRDPNHPEFWDERFQQGFTPWNLGAVPQELRNFVAESKRSAEVVHNCLIPGCGHAHELGFLSEAGWQVTAIDFSSTAVATAKSQVGKWAERVQQADFFEFAPDHPLTLIYERAFFCALPPAMRGAVVERWAALLPIGAKLIGFFLLDDTEGASKKGPPFRTHPQEFQTLIQQHFTCLEDTDVSDSLAVFEGKERWQVWQRR